MRITKLLSIGLLATFGLSAIAQVASAGINVGADTSKKYGDNPYINATGFTPYTSYKIEYGNSNKGYTKKANECGFVKLSATSTTMPIASSNSLYFVLPGNVQPTHLVSDLPVQAAPKCTNGSLSGTNLTPAAFLRTAEGDVYVTGLADFASIQASNLDIPYSKKVKSNGCGLLKVGDVQPGSTVVIKNEAGTTTVHTIADTSLVPTFPISPSCKENTLLLPTGFPAL